MNIETKVSDALVDSTVRGIMENFPEASAGCALRCVSWRYNEWLFKFIDEEDGKRYTLDKAKLR